MNKQNEKTPIKEAPTRLKVTQSKLYRVMKKLGIKPKKEGKKSYLEKKQMTDIFDFLHGYGKSEIDLLSEKLQKEEIKNELLKDKILELETKNDKVFYEMGRQTEEIKRLEEQNEKLLILEAPKKERKKGFFARLFNPKR